MNSFFQRTVEALLPTAVNYAPEGTEAKAVAHQWLHALAYGFRPFAETQGINKADLIALLTAEQLYTDQQSFKNKLPTLPIKPAQTNRFTFIDLFAGIGGMRIGFQQAGGVCVFSSEFEKNAQATYYENHGDHPFGDITKIAVADIPDHDVLIAGFPCQPFSHAGLKKNIEKLCHH